MDPTAYSEGLVYVTNRDGLACSELHPVLASDILTIERELGAQLPEQYEDFLRAVGVGSEYGGLSWWWHLDVTRSGNLLDKNHKLMQSQMKALRAEGISVRTYPAGFLAVYDPCDGEIFGFLRSSATRFLPQVVSWDTESFELSAVASDFNRFLDYLADYDIEELAQAHQQPVLANTILAENHDLADLQDIEDLFR